MPSLISNFEILSSCPAGPQYPLSNINLLRETTEATFLNDFLGSDFYSLMLKDAIDYTKVKSWEQKTYSSGEIVFYNYSILKSTVSLNDLEPSATNDNWKIAPKFNKEIYSKIWNPYLKNIIAFTVYKKCAPLDTIQSGANGLTVKSNDGNAGFVTASKTDQENYLRHLGNLINDMTNELKKYIIEQNNLYLSDNTKGYDYSLINFIKDETKGNIQRPNRRRIKYRY